MRRSRDSFPRLLLVIIIAVFGSVFFFFGWKGILIVLTCIVAGTMAILLATGVIKIGWIERRAKEKRDAQQREWDQRWEQEWNRKWEQSERVRKFEAIQEENRRMKLSGLGEMELYKVILAEVEAKKGASWWMKAFESLLQEQFAWEEKKGIKRDNANMSQADVKKRVDSLEQLSTKSQIVGLERLGMSLPRGHPGYEHILRKLRSALYEVRQNAKPCPDTSDVNDESYIYIIEASKQLDYTTEVLRRLEARAMSKMSQVILCPKCGKRLRWNQQLAGKAGKCPSCNSQFTYPLTI